MFKDIESLNVGKVCYNVDLSRYTTYKISATGAVLVEPTDIEKLKVLVKYIKEKNYKYKVLGNGSNVIFSNPFYDGILIKLNCFKSNLKSLSVDNSATLMYENIKKLVDRM